MRDRWQQSVTPLVRRWPRRLALWLGPILLLVLAWQLWDRLEERRLVRALTSVRDQASSSMPPSRSDVADDAAAYYLAAQLLTRVPKEFLTRVPWGSTQISLAARRAVMSDTPLPDARMKELAEFTRRNGAALRLVREAADLPMRQLDPSSASVSRLYSALMVYAATSLQTMDALLKQDADGAAASLFSQIQLLRWFGRDPWTVNAMTKAIMAEAVVGDAQLVVGHRAVSAARLDEIERGLAGSYQPGELEATVRGEALRLHESAAWLLNGQFFGQLGPAVLARPALRRRQTALLQTANDAIEVARHAGPDQMRRMSTLPDHHSGFDWLPGWLHRDLLMSTVQTADMFRVLTLRVTEAQAAVSAARLAIRVERYRRLHGVTPVRLEDLGESAERDRLVDPFSGQPLLLKSEEHAFVVYSVGKNGRDDGGQVQVEWSQEDVRAGKVARPLDVGVRIAIR